MKYATYNTSGKIIGYYDSAISKNIPTPNVSVSDTEWLDATSNPGKYYVFNNALKVNINYNNVNIQTSQIQLTSPVSNISHALYRNLNDTQSNVTTKTRLLIDGLATGGFNTTGLDIYDTSTSTIKPTSLIQAFIIRPTFYITPKVSGTIFNLTFDVSAGVNVGGTLLVDKYIQLSSLTTHQFIEPFFLYVGSGFLSSGAVINIASDYPVSITKVGLYIMRLI